MCRERRGRLRTKADTARAHRRPQHEGDDDPEDQTGRVEGTVSLKDQLTVEEEGKVFADVEVENLAVHGEMSGDISAGDKVLISASAKVVGDIKAPRVVIEDGARFKGSIEMDVKLPEDI